MKEGLRIITHRVLEIFVEGNEQRNDDIKSDTQQPCQYCGLVNSLLACV